MEIGHFYYIDDQYFKDFPDPYLMQNKEKVNGQLHDRPCFYAFQDSNTQLFWMIPFSSQVSKFKGIYNKKMQKLVLCQDLVQVKMRNFSHFNPPEAQPQCVFFYTIVRIHLVTYSYNGYEFVSYCRKLPDIRKSSSMPACNREF